jgi:hypothetical protein
MLAPRRSMFALTLFAAACVPAAIAAAELSSDAPHLRGGGLFQSLTPPQKMMMLVDMRKATAGMTDDQRKAYRQSQRQKFAAMTDAERQQFAAKLQTEWDALPDDQKESIKQRVLAWRAQHPSRGDEGQGAQ